MGALAHSVNRLGIGHDLIDHLHSVAKLAQGFALDFGGKDLAYYAGLWHDLGKFHPDFQEYLAACTAKPSVRLRGPDHKATGATVAIQQHIETAVLLLQGHHGGLHAPGTSQSWLQERGKDPAVAEALATARRTLPDLLPASPVTVPEHVRRDALSAELFVRLLFSALVDADYLDTEEHFNLERADLRGVNATLADLWRRFEHDQGRFVNAEDTPVNRARREVYQACVEAAKLRPGLFRLTVPTGGGKTRSAMAFALQHGINYGHKRIIVAVPFITITEQTADEYKGIFGGDPRGNPLVLEHHSAAEMGDDEEDFRPDRVWARLAAENWDAPVIGTTTVQLFESLFSNKVSKCRKVHRLAKSIIVLDEAQALPSHLLRPILDVLRQLCEHYGTTVVLSTATQPAFDSIPEFATLHAREIVPEPSRLFDVLRRVNYDPRLNRELSWKEIAELIHGERQALAILNTKKDALALLDALSNPDALHLSTLLCGAHRRRVIGEVKHRPSTREPCILVSTQVVEAGVNLDFPMVLRALGPLDGIIQAAGRCNREGDLGPRAGRVIIFQPEGGGIPQGAYRTGAGVSATLLSQGLDLDSAAAAQRYFHDLYDLLGKQGLDRDDIQSLRKRLDYPGVAEKFHMIDAAETVVVTTYGSEAQQGKVRYSLERLRRGVPDARLIIRELQPYFVSIRKRELPSFQSWLAPVRPGLWEWIGGYHNVRGLNLDGPTAERLVV